MKEQINKKFLENVKFSDSPIAWVLQAKGFLYAAEATLRGNTITKGKRYFSSEEIHLNRFAYKTGCYLLAHSIELSLKAIYCSHGGNNVESFSHKIMKLLDELISKNVLKEEDIHRDTIQLADILLQ